MKLKWSKVSSWHGGLRITGAYLESGARVEIHQARDREGGVTTTGVLRDVRGKLIDRVPLKGDNITTARKRITALLERRAA